MSIRGRAPSANDPSPELLREIRRVKLCRGYDDHGVLVWEQRLLDPPPTWLVREPIQAPPSMMSATRTLEEVMGRETVFHRIGVEVDNAGTWVRYGLSPRMRIPR